MIGFPPLVGPLVTHLGIVRYASGQLVATSLPKIGSPTRAWLRRERARQHEAMVAPDREIVRRIWPSRVEGALW